ncbi:beta strand repeat-containing protein [Flagellimonas sp.]|uniref:beta strand repeat-containing protein n=1 Tax=Flagellimonas sp. TaxID=2058762 RepID=UPI003B508AE6
MKYITLFKLKALTILFLAITLNHVSAQETFRDEFSSVSYSNNDGTVNWATNWIEIDDTDLGPTAEYVYITGNQLRLEWLFTESIYRTANLTGATAATLSFDYTTNSLGGQRELGVYLSNNGGASYTQIAALSGSGSFSQNISAYISSNTTISFAKSNSNWQSDDWAQLDNVQISANIGAVLTIDDVAVNETDGTASLTVTHTGTNASGPFTATFTTADGTALAGSDYTLTTGTLNFNGTSGDTEIITVPITDDGIPEFDETFTVQFTGSSDGTVNITDTATVTINSQVLYNQPLTLHEKFAGYVDYSSTGGTFRTQDNNTDPCAITTSSSGTLISTIPGTATIQKAYLYWAHSSFTLDDTVTFEGQSVSADLIYESGLPSAGVTFYGYVSDVTSIINGIPDPSSNTFDVTDLTIDANDPFCLNGTVLGGWSLMIFYEDVSLPAANINLYLGFDGLSNQGTAFTLDAFYAIAGSGSKASFLSWEGDSTLDGSSAGSTNPEELSITNQASTTFILSGDGGQTGNNAYNSTIYDDTQAPAYNDATTYGLDWDTFDISAYISATDTQVTANVDVGQDFVISNAVVLKVPSNLVTGYVFEDVNYPGGSGRDRTTASGVGISGVTVELYDATNTFVESTTTNSNGQYVFGGMADGLYSIRVVNNTVTSTRGGGSACTSCYGVQTFRSYDTGSGITNVTDEVGGVDPSAQDVAAGTLTGAQTVSQVQLATNGIVGVDFGFNFNTIVNTNESGQGSLEQFIVNSNNLDETGLDIEANTIFDPAAGEDTSIFVMPSSSDPMGRTADSNFSGGYFDISQSNGNPLSAITSDNTVIDGRTQTAYSGDTNTGTVGSGGTSVGTSAVTLPNYELPEIQVHADGADVFQINANSTTVRNLAIYSNSDAGIKVNGGSVSSIGNLLGVNAAGVNAGSIDYGVHNIGGNILVDGNYIATNNISGILIDSGTSNLVQNNHITTNGSSACDDNINLNAGSGIVIQQNLIENAASMGIDGVSISGSMIITENTVTGSGQNGGNCSGNLENMGIQLAGSNAQITNNVVHTNGGTGFVLTGSGTGNLISQNSFYANGLLGIDLNGDSVTLNDNGDVDSGPNNLTNFTIIDLVTISGSNLRVRGWSRPGAVLEFFFTDINEGTATEGDNTFGLSTDYGEGQLYIGTGTEGSGSDLDATSSLYADADGNIDTTNKFEFLIPLPSGTALGEKITATATVSNSTSEFSPFFIVSVATVITNRRITYRVNPN